MAELAAPSHAQTTDVLALLQADGLPSLNRQLVGWGEAVLGLQGLQLQRCHDGPAGCGCSRTVALQDTEGEALGRLCWQQGELPRGARWQQLLAVMQAWLLRDRQTAALSHQVHALERAERIQRALFAVADMAGSDLEMTELLRIIHEILRGLMYADNLAIVRYDEDRQVLRFMYFVDLVDELTPDAVQEIPLSELDNSLTLAMIRSGEPARGPSEPLREKLGVPRDELLGPDSADWLGVPMVRSGRVRGAIVVQSYDERQRFSAEDEALLSYVAQHILTALERKEARDELEAQVEARTRALNQANQELRLEVQERQRGERLQQALFRIAELSVSTATLEDFYRAVHRVVGELLDARNFYIALLAADGDELVFPYSVDERDAARPPRKLSKGLTEYVLRHGEPLLADRTRIIELAASGEVQSFGSRSVCWLGVPLICDDRTVGVLAVQSYTDEARFSQRDLELLTFVSYHIATGLQRKQAQDSLQQAYQELEQRVADRTRELAATNRELVDQIGERQRIEERLKHQALHDGLTGLPNRRFLLDRLELALMRYRLDHDRGFAVLFVDLDRFKVVNDSVGHLVGDELLKQAATRIQGVIRDSDVVARLGGDEFAILLEDLRDDAAACRVAQSLIEAFADPVRVAGKELFSSASIGITLAHPRYLRAEELLRDADAAMYRAKERGRQRFEVFDERLRAEALRVLDLEGDLRRGLTRGEFEVFLQPIVRMDDRSVAGHEALLRWRHPKRGLLLPDEFLGVAEDIGCLEQMDWLVLDRACQILASGGVRHGYICVNVNARQLRSSDFDRQVLDTLKRHNVAGERVRLEVTEGALLEDPETTRTALLQLREAGVVAQLDDFGTGYSSLSYLHRFPLKAVKIDRSFVAGLLTDEGDSSAAVVRAIVAIAGSLHLEVIAEGIETPAQATRVTELGCVYGQGYWYARPSSAGAVLGVG
ncbi:MAG: EAL domain-containing protein [Xanthomonadales bacterium]|nr:EAL domain-containing protein [Xanthomonadales bacterium]